MNTNKSFSQLNDFNIPRIISTGLKIKIFFNNPFATIGLFFFLFGCIFPLFFGTMIDFRSAFSFKENDPTVNAFIIDVSSTGNKINKKNVMDYTYRYDVNGKSYTGHSFSTDPDLQDSVFVQYLPNDVSISKIKGLQAAPFPFFVLPLTCIFPLIGLIFLIFGIRRTKKNIYLVQNGILTTGKVVRKEPTSTKVNKQTVYKVFFQFKTKDGNFQESFVRTHKTHNLGDEAEEPLVYDGQDPKEAVLLDALPKKIRTLLTGM